MKYSKILFALSFAGIMLGSCTTVSKLPESPVAFYETTEYPVTYTSYHIYPGKIEVYSGKNESSVLKKTAVLRKGEYETLLKTLQENKLPFIKEDLKKAGNTDHIRITTHLPDMKVSVSNAGGISPDDSQKWKNITDAFRTLFKEKNLAQ